MQTEPTQTSDFEVVERTCDQCKMKVFGILFDGFLWPVWMKKKNAKAFQPHGPRIFNEKLKECWHCSMKRKDDWHR